MPSPTGVTNLVRKKKLAGQGKRRKRALRRKGTPNFLTTGFPSEIKKAAKA